MSDAPWNRGVAANSNDGNNAGAPSSSQSAPKEQDLLAGKNAARDQLDETAAMLRWGLDLIERSRLGIYDLEDFQAEVRQFSAAVRGLKRKRGMAP